MTQVKKKMQLRTSALPTMLDTWTEKAKDDLAKLVPYKAILSSRNSPDLIRRVGFMLKKENAPKLIASYKWSDTTDH